MVASDSQFLHSNERIDQLYSQDIKIIQSEEVFSFSLDAVLLANFVPESKKRHLKIVDLCSGNGAVGLFLHERLAGNVTQVEIQPRLAEMNQRSILLNQLENRYQVLNIDLNDVFGSIPKDSVDLITCNPPYFSNFETSKKNPNPYLAIARHEIKTNLNMVLEKISGLLKMNGRAYLVHRPDRLEEIFANMRELRLAPKKIQFIYPKENRNANMVLIEMIKDGKLGGVKIVPPLVINEKNSDEYSPEVRKLLYGK